MKNNRYIALGDLIADFYYNGNKLLAFDGGSTRYNVIANLANFNKKCAVIGGCGNDEYGIKIVKRLEKMGVDTSEIFYKDRAIRGYHLSINQDKLPKITYKCSKVSPQDGKSTWYDSNLNDIQYLSGKLKEDDVIILDDLDEFSLYIINQYNQDKIIDIGNTKKLEKFKENQLEKLKEKFQIMQLNERVVPYLIQRLNGKDIADIYSYFQPKLLIVTREKNGADFVYENKVYQKKLTKIAKEIDATGAGDAFLSVFVKKYYENSKNVDFEFIDSAFIEASNFTYEVVQNIGARGHLYERKFDKINPIAHTNTDEELNR